MRAKWNVDHFQKKRLCCFSKFLRDDPQTPARPHYLRVSLRSDLRDPYIFVFSGHFSTGPPGHFFLNPPLPPTLTEGAGHSSTPPPGYAPVGLQKSDCEESRYKKSGYEMSGYEKSGYEIF